MLQRTVAVASFLRFLRGERTVVAAGSSQQGRIEGSADVHVFGRFGGTIHSLGAVVIERGGRVDGPVEATSVVVRGELYGNARASGQLRIDGGMLEGDAAYGSLEVKGGGTIRGKTHSLPPAAAEGLPPAAFAPALPVAAESPPPPAAFAPLRAATTESVPPDADYAEAAAAFGSSPPAAAFVPAFPIAAESAPPPAAATGVAGDSLAPEASASDARDDDALALQAAPPTGAEAEPSQELELHEAGSPPPFRPSPLPPLPGPARVRRLPLPPRRPSLPAP